MWTCTCSTLCSVPASRTPRPEHAACEMMILRLHVRLRSQNPHRTARISSLSRQGGSPRALRMAARGLGFCCPGTEPGMLRLVGM